ncbi:PAS domain S-box protein, partial [Aetokthonos hydrillicola]|uniref:PAS domain S-box protein n=1 Tax=Aetokthonos hydrillicola TaxID=1550245 RepID=UPI001ABA81D8
MDETVNALHTPEKEALRLLEKIAANLSGMIFQLLQRQDGSKSILYASSGCRDLFELEPEDVQQDFQAIYNLIHPEDIKAFEESIATSSTRIIPWRWEGRIITNSNKLKWIQGTACPEIQKEGDVVWDGFLTNITDRKQAELSLWESEQKFSKAFRCSPTPISILKLQDGRYVDANDAFVEISGFSREEVINRTPGELNIWNNSAEGARIQRMLLEEGFVRNLEAEFYTKSGELKVVLFSAEMITLGEQACVLCVMNDITQRKKTEELLLLSAKRDRLFSQTLTRIRHSLNLDQVLHTTVNEVRQFLQADRVFIALRDTLGKSKILAESVDPEYPSVLNWKPEHEIYLLELRKLLTTHRVRVVEDITQVTSPELQGLYQEFRTRATLAVPIILNDEWFGALVANQCREARHWTAMEIDLLQQMSEQVAIAIQQAQLYQELAELNANLELQVQDRTAQLQQKMEEIQELSRVKDVVLHTVSHDLRTTVMGNLMVLNNLLNNSVEDKQQRDDSSPLVISRRVIERMIQGNDRQLGMIDSLLEIHASIEQGVVLRTEV